MEFFKYPELPLELRLQIIEEAINVPNPLRLKTHFASWASVDSEWNRVIERHLFRSIKISNEDVTDFGRICDKRHHLLEWILLQLHVPCPDDLTDLTEPRKVVTDSVSQLFHTMKDWNRAERPHGLITLSISMPISRRIWIRGDAADSLSCDFTNLPEVSVIGRMYTRERADDKFHLHYSSANTLHRKLPNLHSASLALPSGNPLQETINDASCRIVASHDAKPSLAELSIMQNPSTRTLARERSKEITIAKSLAPLVALWSQNLVLLKLDCVIDITQFLLTASNSMWPNLDWMNVVGIVDEDEMERGDFVPDSEYRACNDLLRGLTAALPNMPKLTKFDTRFREQTEGDWAFCLCVDLGTRRDTGRLVYQPTRGYYTGLNERPVIPCCPLEAERGMVIARDVVLPGNLVTELQNTVWQHRHLELAVFCCREDEIRRHPVSFLSCRLPCTRWNKETHCWDLVFMNDMDPFIYAMGQYWEELTTWEDWAEMVGRS